MLGLKGFAILDIHWHLVLVVVGVAILGRTLLQGPPRARSMREGRDLDATSG